MLETIAERVCTLIFLPHIRKIERRIGHKLMFRDIPSRFIDGIVPWDMTAVWQRFGLDIEAGANYWTIGTVRNGVSSRYDRNAPEYQAWLGGYTVKLPPGGSWTPEDHAKLAIADQSSWLGTYGDPNPLASVEGWTFVPRGQITSGKYSGTLYETGGVTHSDVGQGKRTLNSRLSPFVQAAFLNLSNRALRMKGSMLVLRTGDNPYEALQLRAYFAIFDLGDNANVILYGNGAIIQKKEGDIDTFPMIEGDLLKAMRACEIVKV
jgi:hypothetical protein